MYYCWRKRDHIRTSVYMQHCAVKRFTQTSHKRAQKSYEIHLLDMSLDVRNIQISLMYILFYMTWCCKCKKYHDHLGRSISDKLRISRILNIIESQSICLYIKNIIFTKGLNDSLHFTFFCEIELQNKSLIADIMAKQSSYFNVLS